MRLIAAYGAIAVFSFASDRAEDLILEGKFTDALPILEAARDAASGRHDAEAAAVLNNLGSVYDQLGRLRDAQSMYERSLVLRRESGESDSQDAARTLNNLGSVYMKLQLYSKAEETLAHAARINGSRVWINLGLLYQAEHRWDEAESMFRKALDERERELGPEHRDVAIALNNLGVLLQSRKRLDEAEPLLARAVRIWEHAIGAAHPWVAAGMNNLGVVYAALGRSSEAEARFKRALEIAASVLPANHPNLASYRMSYAKLLRGLGRRDEAKRLEDSAMQARASFQRDNLIGYTVDARVR
jgi:tetratricopeptide (TPR) repeat protein